jgi:hypothetical protein
MGTTPLQKSLKHKETKKTKALNLEIFDFHFFDSFVSLCLKKIIFYVFLFPNSQSISNHAHHFSQLNQSCRISCTQSFNHITPMVAYCLWIYPIRGFKNVKNSYWDDKNEKPYCHKYFTAFYIVSSNKSYYRTEIHY